MLHKPNKYSYSKTSSPMSLSQGYEYEFSGPYPYPSGPYPYPQSACGSQIEKRAPYVEEEVYQYRSLAVCEGRRKKEGKFVEVDARDVREDRGTEVGKMRCVEKPVKQYIKIRDMGTQTEVPELYFGSQFSLQIQAKTQQPEKVQIIYPDLITSSEYCRSIFQTAPQKVQIFQTARPQEKKKQLHQSSPSEPQPQKEEQKQEQNQVSDFPELFFSQVAQNQPQNGQHDSLNFSLSLNLTSNTQIQQQQALQPQPQPQSQIPAPLSKHPHSHSQPTDSEQGSIKFESDSDQDQVMLEQTTHLLDMTRIIDANLSNLRRYQRREENSEWRTESQQSLNVGGVRQEVRRPMTRSRTEMLEKYRKISIEAKTLLPKAVVDEFERNFIEFHKSDPKFRVIPRRNMFSFLGQICKKVQQARKPTNIVPQQNEITDKDTILGIKISKIFTEKRIAQLQQLFVKYHSGYFKIPERHAMFNDIRTVIKLCKECK